jgi:hypothetical protein
MQTNFDLNLFFIYKVIYYYLWCVYYFTALILDFLAKSHPYRS